MSIKIHFIDENTDKLIAMPTVSEAPRDMAMAMALVKSLWGVGWLRRLRDRGRSYG